MRSDCLGCGRFEEEFRTGGIIDPVVGVGAEIRTADLPVFPASRAWNCDPVSLALHGGEDYELLFAVPKSGKNLLENRYPSKFPGITQIGRLTGTVPRVWTLESGKRRRLPPHGHDHFRRNPLQ